MENEVLLKRSVQVSEDVVSRNLQGEAVILNLKTNAYCGIDPIGTRIWDLIQEGKSLGDIRAALLEEYDVAEDQCTEDLLAFIQLLKENQLIEG